MELGQTLEEDPLSLPDDEPELAPQEKASPLQFGPSPAETDAMAWTAIDEISQRKRCVGARGLGGFLRETAHPYKTPKGDERTNIIDQGERITYFLGGDHLQQLFRHLEACRLEGSTAHFSERQGTAAAPRTGIMLDFDMIVPERKPALSDRHYYRLAGALAAALQRDVDFTAPAGQEEMTPRPAGRKPPKKQLEAKFHMFFIVKPEAIPVVAKEPAVVAIGAAGGASAAAAAAAFKYGIHILVPGVKLGRAYKKWLLREFKTDPAVIATLQELGARGPGATGDPSECLDQNSASVPVLFLGSCKRGGTPYTLGAALEITVDVGVTGASGWVPPPVVRRLGDEDLRPYNLVAELSLVTEAEYQDGKAALVRKVEFDPRPEVAEKAHDWGERSQGGITPSEELLLAEHTLSTLTLHDAEARHIHALLDLLDPSYYTERNKWRDVVFALANTSDRYKPLAVWFSQKCPRKWSDGGLPALDQMWEDALARRGSVDRPLTIHSLRFWARASDPERYAEVIERSYFTMMLEFVYDHMGKLQHYMVAKVLYAMLGSKFCVDISEGPRGGKSYCWFEFVIPGQAMKTGEVWKWRQEVEPDDVHIYMSESLTQVLEQISEHIDEKAEAAVDEGQAKYYKTLAKNFAGSKLSLYNDTFKNGVIRQANFLFRRRGFVEKLDKIPNLFGCGNGVLQLGPRCVLIDHFHEHPVSMYSTAIYRRFDATRPMMKIVLQMIEDIIPEPDARDWILFHAAQGLLSGEKEGLLLLWEGGGQNGKTTFLRAVAKALGPKAGKFNIQLMACEREDADKPNSAMMRFKQFNYAYAEEANKATALNVARMKEMVNPGEVSGRDLHGKQEEFTMHSNMVAASQYSFIVDTTDHGTWRRLRHYTSKTKFRKNPDPDNPYEKKDDQRFVREYPSDPEFQAEFLSLLVHYLERLFNEYGGELKSVPSPTIERETEEFRVSQDTLHRWLCESIVVSPECDAEYPLGVLGGHYTEWYSIHIERKRHVASDVIKAMESSALAKFLKPAPNRTQVLKGCRVLTADDLRDLKEIVLRPGEEFLSVVENQRIQGVGVDGFARARAGREGLPWWAARTAAPATPAARAADAREDADDFVDDFADDEEILRAERPLAVKKRTEVVLDDSEIDTLLETGHLTSSLFSGHPSYTLDDVYEEAALGS